MPVPTGEAFTDSQRLEINRAISDAHRICGRVFSVYVGPADGAPAEGASRAFAEKLLAKLPDPSNSILIQVDPEQRCLEIVTGSDVKRSLSNRQAALAAINMQAGFITGDLTRGLLVGIQQLAQLARPPQSLHTRTP